MPGMTRLSLVLFFSCLFLLAPEIRARADVAPPPPMFKRVAGVEVIAVGQVIGFQDQDVQALTHPGTNKKVPYRIAIVQVTESLKGKLQDKTIRVGFPAPPNTLRYGIQFKQTQNGMFFLKKHFQESFFVAPGYYDFINSNNNPSFPKTIKEVKEVVALEGNPLAMLKSSDPEKRLLAAAMLVAKYRQPQQQPAKQEPIDPAESKLILQALANADWKKPRNYQDLSPLAVFAQLGVGKADGFQQANIVTSTPNGYANAVQDWLRNQGEKYQIKRFVPAESK